MNLNWWQRMAVLGLGMPGLWAQEPLLVDDFEGEVVDAALWRVSLPFSNAPASRVTVTNKSLSLFRRGGLESVAGFAGGLDLEGRFRFTGENEVLSVVFRSDLTMTDQVERRGVQVAFQQGTGTAVLIPEPFDSTPTVGSHAFFLGRDETFRIVDNGSLVRLFMGDPYVPLWSVTVTNRRGDHLALYSGLGISGGVSLDEFTVHPFQTTVFVDDVLTRSGPVRKSQAVTVRVQSCFAGVEIYYTLDGTAPSFIATPYTGPVALSNSATFRAISYRADYLESSESIALEIQVAPDVTLTDETPGGGVVLVDPAGPSYPSNSTVSVTAIPAPGWEFLRWEGALGGTSTNQDLVMTNHLVVRAVFGTRPTFTAVGAGTVRPEPAGPVHAYGSAVRLMAVPDPGQGFFRWANALTSGFSPATLRVTNSAPAVSALFTPLADQQRALTVWLEGSGTVTGTPGANILTHGQSVTLTAVPDPGQVFVGWGGDAAGFANPLTLVMDGDRGVTARFAPGLLFEVPRSGVDATGFALTGTSPPEAEFRLEVSADLASWAEVVILTNTTGTLTFRHAEATNRPVGFYRATPP